MLLICSRVFLLGLCVAKIRGQSGCKSTPSQKLQDVDEGCQQDIGFCTMAPCTQCLLPNPTCCGPVLERTIAECPNGPKAFSKVIECKCLPCEEPQVFIAGNVENCGGGCLNIKIEIKGVEVTRCNSDGTFAFKHKPKNNRIFLSFIDDSKQFFPGGRVVETEENKPAYTISLRLLEGSSIPTFDSSEGTSVEADTNGNVVVQLKENSFTYPDGTLYIGMVTGSINYIDPSDEDDIPVPLLTEGDGSGPQLLSSSGMIQLNLVTPSGEALNAYGVRLSRKTADLTPEEIAGMGIWTVDPETSYWILLLSMTASTENTRRKKRQVSNATAIEGEIDVLAGAIRIWNLDALVGPYCFTKARIFLNSVDEANQMANILFKSYYFRDNSAANYIRTFSDSNGACMPIQCNNRILKITRIIGPSLSNAVESPLPEGSESLFNVTASSAWRIEMKTDNTAVLPNGPIYSSFTDCYNAPFTDYYFGFILTAPETTVVETNVVSIDEDNIFSPWIDDVFSWWPNRNRSRACYMKIDTEVFETQTFKIQSLGGNHTTTKGEEYGTRSVTTYSNFACVEYKCPDTLSDGEYDRTMIVVTVLNNDTIGLTSVNRQLYSASEYATMVDYQVGNRNSNFTALVPILESAYGNGVYIAENIHPTLAKEAALKDCTVSGPTAIRFQKLHPSNTTLINF